jgi:hypothetical protein
MGILLIIIEEVCHMRIQDSRCTTPVSCSPACSSREDRRGGARLGPGAAAVLEVRVVNGLLRLDSVRTATTIALGCRSGGGAGSESDGLLWLDGDSSTMATTAMVRLLFLHSDGVTSVDMVAWPWI